MIRTNLAAGLLAVTVGAAAIDAPTPAAAAGSVSVTVTQLCPHNPAWKGKEGVLGGA
jgi:hypothetical protein